MNLQGQKIDAFNKIKDLVVKYDLNISDEEISDCVEHYSVNPLSFVLSRCSAEDSLNIVNNQMGSNFTPDSSFYEILKELSEKWESL